MKPMRTITMFGALAATCSFLFGILVIVEKIIYPETEVGWTSLVVLITMLFGIQFIFMGVIGEYIGKQYLDQNGTPQWTIKRII